MLPKPMNETTAITAIAPKANEVASEFPRNVAIKEIFGAFLLIGATSFGGGLVAYLRSSLVGKRAWIDDQKFVELLSISQTLPGLNATNMAILVGDRLRGFPGAIAAICGLCLPGALLMYAAGMVYHVHGDRPLVTAILHGAAAAAVGLILATTVQLSRRSLEGFYDLVFVVLAVIGVNRLHLSVPYVLLGVGALAILRYRPHSEEKEDSRQ
jgi:chromate transporter